MIARRVHETKKECLISKKKKGKCKRTGGIKCKKVEKSSRGSGRMCSVRTGHEKACKRLSRKMQDLLLLRFVAFWRLSPYDVCHLWRLSHYEVCSIMRFVAYDVCLPFDICRLWCLWPMTIVAYDICHLYVLCRVCRSISSAVYELPKVQDL